MPADPNGFDPDEQTVLGAPRPSSAAVADQATLPAAGQVDSPSPRLRRGQSVGRFIVIRPLGSGAMGEVVAAYDPELHRRVAIKVLHLYGYDRSQIDAERMLREARAMAQLSHPNVITIFEVDRFDSGQLFIAMELVDGETLRSWSSHRDHRFSWKDIIQTYVQAGRGLAAAHAAGMVHRDFKPDNALIDRDGRVRVTDFGLVGLDPTATHPTGMPDDVDPAVTGLPHATLTQTGALMGTPAYMAPEQEHRQADARSDQFSFCVALYEALYGERPFAGATLSALRLSVAQGTVRPEPKNHGVPSWLRAILVRGLAPDPAARWPDMTTLVQALEHDPSLRRRRIAVTGAGVLVTIALTTLPLWASRTQDDPCTTGEIRSAGLWNPEMARQLNTAWGRLGTEAADHAAKTLNRAFSNFADQWRAEHREACEATLVRHEQSERLFDQRMQCLDRQYGRAQALISAFAKPTGDSLQKVEDAASALPSAKQCADIHALEARIPAPADPKQRAQWDLLHAELDRADALGVTGDEISSLSLFESLKTAVEEFDHRPLTARWRLNYGNALVRQQRWQEAIDVLSDGPNAAAASGDATVEAQMWLLLAKAYGFGLNDARTGAALAKAAEVAAVRAAQDADLPIGIQYTLSLLRDAEGDFPGAVDHAQRAVELAREAHGDQHRTTSTLYGNLGNALDHAGRYDEAMQAHRTALQIDTELHGSLHPDVAHSLVNIGLLQQTAGDYTAAQESFSQALEIYKSTVGRKHGAYATALLNLANNATYRLQFTEARDRLLALLELYRETRPEDEADIARAHNNLGSVYIRLGQLDEGEAHYRHAYEIRLRIFGPEHPSVMHAINAMAQVMAHRGNFAGAEAELRRAVEIGEHSLPKDHPDLAYPLQNLGDALAAQGRYEEAILMLERAVGVRASIDPNLLGRSHFALGRALWFTDRKRAQRELDLARDMVDDLGRSEIDQFLASVR